MSEPPRTHRGAQLRRASWRRRLVASYSQRYASYRSRSLAWRLLVPGVFVLVGGLFVTSAVNADGTDLRSGRYGDLGSLVREHKTEADQLRTRANLLTEEVNALSEAVDDGAVKRVQARIEDLRQPAGLQPVEGPGLSVTLEDAPEEIAESADVGVNDLVVHQQDIQAVVNAMWAGGAEAMTIQGQRVISTTGIKCVGNTVVLHNIPYSPPYVITAVGDPSGMLESIDTNRYIEIYKQYVEAYELGYDVEALAQVQLPAYEGTLDLRFARPAGDTIGDADSDL